MSSMLVPVFSNFNPEEIPMTLPETASTSFSVPMPEMHEPGIYFGLDEDLYHADPSLGSSNLKTLAKNPSTYWFSSWMNPRRPKDKDTPARARGRAVHQLVLYGEDHFDSNFMRGAVHDDDMTAAEKGAATKAANAAAAKLGKVALPADVYDNIVIASAMIAKNPKLATALRNGINEVSIFWREHVASPTTGEMIMVPMKARYDCMKPRGIGDLKSITNMHDKPFDRCCIESISNYRYDVQAKHYMNCRPLLADFIKKGRVFGDHDPAFLQKVGKSPAWAFQFVFWQAEGAPITYSKVLSPGNPLLELAENVLEKAKANYVDYMERIGPNEMWLLAEEPSELFLDEMPGWFAR